MAAVALAWSGFDDDPDYKAEQARQAAAAERANRKAYRAAVESELAGIRRRLAAAEEHETAVLGASRRERDADAKARLVADAAAATMTVHTLRARADHIAATLKELAR